MANAKVPPEVDEFLSQHSRTFLFTLRKDGSPTAHPMLGIYGDGILSFSSYRGSAKTYNAQRRNKACCLVVDGYETERPRGVVFRGNAETVEADQMPERRRLTETRVTPGVSGRAGDRLKTGKRILIKVAADDTAAFLDQVRGG